MAAYTYDSRNRLTSVLNLSYKYDAENNRIASTDEQTKKNIRYIHNTNSDLSQLLVEESETSTTKYVYGNELICAKTYEKSLEELKQEGEGQNKQSGKQQADITYYYHYDNLKSTTLLTDATGQVVETYNYGTYGEITSGDTTLTRFLYNGGLGVSNDSSGLYYMRARYYNPVIRRFINQDVETGSMDDSASLNRYAYVQGNPVSLTDPFGLSPDMELGNYEANALKSLFKVADKVADFLPVIGTARDIKRSYNAFKNGNIADGIKHGATAALSLAGPAAKALGKAGSAVKKAMKAAKALKAEKCASKTAKIASDGIKLARDVGKVSKLANKAGSVSAKIAKTVKNGVSTVARTVKKNAAKVFKGERSRSVGNDSKKILNVGAGDSPIPGAINIDIDPKAPGVFFGDVNDLYQFDSGYFDYVIALHPYKYDLLDSDVPRIMKDGGTLCVTGNPSNGFFNSIYNMSPEKLGQIGFEILYKGKATDVLKKYGGKISDGSREVRGEVLQINLKKVGRK